MKTEFLQPNTSVFRKTIGISIFIAKEQMLILQSGEQAWLYIPATPIQQQTENSSNCNKVRKEQ